ncbi:dGTP triphosphohydrolase [Streptomyces sp. NPDC047072]|uniref:deoxyguanosinetriphosphate triphosphohydrolase family protein n=1 Tax=Streptomyces sp. NPDC047072 TaxID=3154809 RepID=UPI0033F4754C
MPSPESFDAERPSGEVPPIPHEDSRTPYQHDRDRLLYSSAFRRLAGVTQVAAVREYRLLHNRLTHSLKVAQIARRTAERLVRIEGFQSDLEPDSAASLPDIAETAGLAHDIGHPPFGHIAESVLDRRMKPLGGFEGNAQSFRIVTKLAVRRRTTSGLDLTRASLNGILKYPRFREQVPPKTVSSRLPFTDRSRGSKWGVYGSERQEFIHARKQFEGTWPDEARSVAAILMDWADDISFATHDIDDYFKAGLIPLQDLRLPRDQDAFFTYSKTKLCGGFDSFPEGFDWDSYQREFERILPSIPLRKYTDSRYDRLGLVNFVTRQIAELARALHPAPSPRFIDIDGWALHRAEVLKQIHWFYVIDRPPLLVAQKGQEAIIGNLFDILIELLQGGMDKIPVTLREIYLSIILDEAQTRWWASEDEKCGRAVCDYLCSLTEDQAVDLYERLTGFSISRGSIFGTWFH